MKIVKKSLGKTADVSSARRSGFRELRKLLAAVVLLAVSLYFAIGLTVDAVVARISFEKEDALFGSGTFFTRNQKSADPRLKRAQSILSTLVSDTQVPPLKYRLKYLENDEMNAVAFPGGAIGVTQGLLDALEDDIALAFVLGHELGHFYNRDHLRGIGRAVGVGIVYAIVFGGQMGDDNLGNVFHSMLQRSYSRRQEEKADRFGLELVFRIYGKTDGLDRLFRILEDKEDMPCWAYMFATHPSPKSRIMDLKKYAERL